MVIVNRFHNEHKMEFDDVRDIDSSDQEDFRDLGSIDTSRVKDLFSDDQMRYEAMFNTPNGVQFKTEDLPQEDVPRFREDEQFCEVSPPPNITTCGSTGLLSDRQGEGENKSNQVFYPPERPPPIYDFLTIMSAFAVAVLAAYFSINV